MKLENNGILHFELDGLALTLAEKLANFDIIRRCVIIYFINQIKNRDYV